MYAPAVRLAKPALLLVPLLGSLALTGPARADVVMSPPKSCPPGHTPVTSHAGPRCLANAPTNCPAGWTGILGGHCVLDVCDPGGEATCRAGTECKAQDLCGEEKLVEWGWGAAPPPPRDNALGAPARRFDPPRHDFHYDDVCSAGKCAAGRTCFQTGVCLPRAVARAASKPSNGGDVRGYTPKNAKTSSPDAGDDGDAGRFAKPPPSSSATSAPSATAAPSATEAPPTSGDDAGAAVIDGDRRARSGGPPRGGCTGCGGQPVGMLGGSVVVGLVLTRLRKRSDRREPARKAGDR